MMEDDGGLERTLMISLGALLTVYFLMYEGPSWYVAIIGAATAFLLYKRVQIMRVALSPQIQLVVNDLHDIKNELKRMVGVK